MILIQQQVHDITQEGLSVDCIEQCIESAGRTCYKSEDKITPDSAHKFVRRLVKAGHWSMLEFGTVYLDLPRFSKGLKDIFKHHPRCIYNGGHVTTNLRVLYELDRLDALKYIPNGIDESWIKRMTFRFITDRGTSHELVRHRAFAYAQESTRYCNYSNNHIIFIQPNWCNAILGKYNNTLDTKYRNLELKEKKFINNCLNVEKVYNELISTHGCKAQDARAVLTNSLKTEICMCGFEHEWRGVVHNYNMPDEDEIIHTYAIKFGFIPLRTDSKSHPMMQIVAKQVEEILNSKYNDYRSRL